MLLFDDNKIKMARRNKKNTVRCTGENKGWDGNLREAKTGTVLELIRRWGDPCDVTYTYKWYIRESVCEHCMQFCNICSDYYQLNVKVLAEKVFANRANLSQIFDWNYPFPIDFVPLCVQNFGISFCAKSIGKV